MAANNTSQIFSVKGILGWATVTAANTAMDGTGTLDAAGTATTTTGHLGTMWTAPATTNDGRAEMIRCKALGTNIATVARFFINNGSTNATAANNTLIAELDLPATTASNTTSNLLQEIPSQNGTGDQTILPMVIPPGYKLMVCLGTAVSAGWQFTVIGGGYG